MGLFDELISKHAQMEVVKLHTPLDDNQAAELVDWFRVLKGNPKPPEKLKDAGIELPNSLLMYMSVLLGSPVELQDDEVGAEDIGIGAVLTYKGQEEDYSKLPEWMVPAPPEPQLIAYHDYLEERVYLLEPYAMRNKGLFGGMHTWITGFAARESLAEAVKRHKEIETESKLSDEDVTKIEETLEQIPEMPDTIQDPTMDQFQFLNLPQGQRTPLTYLNWVVQFNEARKYELSSKSEDIKFQIDLRRQFS